MTITIRATVGKGGVNHPDDVRKIQELLNAVPEDSGGPRPRLAVDGLCGRTMLDNILRFQSRPFFGAAYGWIEPGGRTLQKLNEFAVGRVSRPTWIERNLGTAPALREQKLPLLFSHMWELIQRKHVHNAASFPSPLTSELGYLAQPGRGFPPELLIGIFWEETNFRNVPGRVSKFWGFGQVDKGRIGELNVTFGKNFLEAALLTDNEMSVEFASTFLASWLKTRGNREAALKGYAGVGHEGIVAHWKRCEAMLLSFELGRILVLTDTLVEAIKRALAAARPSEVFPPVFAFA